MPHSRLEDLPAGGGGRWGAGGDAFRSAQWGDMEVGFTHAEPMDCTELYEGLPGGVCPCPHYGYIFEGAIRARWPGTDLPDEVAVAGEAYFFPAGHVLIYEQRTVALELNPAYALNQMMSGIHAALLKRPDWPGLQKSVDG